MAQLEYEGNLLHQTNSYRYIRGENTLVHIPEQDKSDSHMEGTGHISNGTNHQHTAPYQGYYCPVSAEQMNESWNET